MIKKNLLIVLLLLLMYCVFGENKISGFSMQLPDIPTIIFSDTERQKYLISHFWDNCNFENNELLHHKNDFQSCFQQYVLLLSSYPNRNHFGVMINSTLSRLKNADTATIKYFVSLYENYFYNPISNYRNDDIYIPVLQFLINCEKFTDTDKTKWRYRLKMASKNQIGEVATFFSYQLSDNSTKSLSAIKSDYTILYFYNPDCQQCKTTQQMLQMSDILQTAILNNKLTILAIYSDKDYSLWIKSIKHHKGWIYGYDEQHVIQSKGLYDLKAIPTLYLLDKTKLVLLKDTDVRTIEEYMKKRKQ